VVNCHLVICGTSIIDNYSRIPTIPDEDKRICENDHELLERSSPANTFFLKVYEYLKRDPWRASAELNAMRKYLENGLVNEVYLYHTDTGRGRFCATILEKYLRDIYMLQKIESIRVEGFGVKEYFEDGLVNLLDKLMDKIQKLTKPGNKIYLNATGGFKPENAITIIAASLLNINEIYYIHEKFIEPIKLPILPITINPKYTKLLKELHQEHKLHGFTPKTRIEKEYGSEIINELKERNLVKEENGKIILRKWTEIMIKHIKL